MFIIKLKKPVVFCVMVCYGEHDGQWFQWETLYMPVACIYVKKKI